VVRLSPRNIINFFCLKKKEKKEEKKAHQNSVVENNKKGQSKYLIFRGVIKIKEN